MPRWVVWLVVAIVVFLVLCIGFVFAIVFFVLGIMRHSPGHVCASYYVRQSVVAQRFAGLPLADAGFPSGSSDYNGNTLTYAESFQLRGPRGTIAVDAQGVRSPFASHLDVRMTVPAGAAMVYSGAFDCPPLHSQR